MGNSKKNHIKNDLLAQVAKKLKDRRQRQTLEEIFRKVNKYVYLGCNDFYNLNIPNRKRKI
jgi:hypothetical protein